MQKVMADRAPGYRTSETQHDFRYKYCNIGDIILALEYPGYKVHMLIRHSVHVFFFGSAEFLVHDFTLPPKLVIV